MTRESDIATGGIISGPVFRDAMDSDGIPPMVIPSLKPAVHPDHGHITPELRKAIIDSVLANQALAGIYVDRDKAEQLMDNVLSRPTIEIRRKP